MPDKVLVCPECRDCANFKVLDKLDYNVESLECINCGWIGESDDLIPVEDGGF